MFVNMEEIESNREKLESPYRKWMVRIQAAYPEKQLEENKKKFQKAQEFLSKKK